MKFEGTFEQMIRFLSPELSEEEIQALLTKRLVRLYEQKKLRAGHVHETKQKEKN